MAVLFLELSFPNCNCEFGIWNLDIFPVFAVASADGGYNCKFQPFYSNQINSYSLVFFPPYQLPVNIKHAWNTFFEILHTYLPYFFPGPMQETGIFLGLSINMAIFCGRESVFPCVFSGWPGRNWSRLPAPELRPEVLYLGSVTSSLFTCVFSGWPGRNWPRLPAPELRPEVVYLGREDRRELLRGYPLQQGVYLQAWAR